MAFFEIEGTNASKTEIHGHGKSTKSEFQPCRFSACTASGLLTKPTTHIQGFVFLDSAAAVFACPPSFTENNLNLTSSGLKLRSFGDLLFVFSLSLSLIEDGGWTCASSRAVQVEVLRQVGTALRHCPFCANVDDAPARQVRENKIPR